MSKSPSDSELDRLSDLIRSVMRTTPQQDASEVPLDSEQTSSLRKHLKHAASSSADQSNSAQRALGRLDDYPEMIGPYRRLHVLGQGGMGIVFLAQHISTKSKVALKLIRTDRFSNPDAVKRFGREADALRQVARLPHDSFIEIRASGYDKGFAYIATDLVYGIDLSVLLSLVCRCPVGAATEIGRQVADGLSQLQSVISKRASGVSAAIVHRDIKPSNIMLAHDGKVRILDFGLVLLKNNEPIEECCGESLIIGTRDYMAIEQIRDPVFATERSDVYSLGVMLFQLLTGRLPFPTETVDSRDGLIKILMSQEARPLNEFCPNAQPGLAVLINRMLSREAEARPSAHEVACSLEEFASRLDLIKIARKNILPVRSKTLFWSILGLLVVCSFLLAAFVYQQKPIAVLPLIGPSSSANSPMREPTSGVLPAKEPVTERPISVEWNPDEFASAGPVELPEPPPLDEWLFVKKIITVKQDGSGDYRTIFEACQRRQSGEVVEVLDVGPYVENLKMMPMPPGSGLFSRVGTVIIPAQWDVKNTKKASSNRDVLNFFLHGLGQSPDFRLSGFNFHWESILDAQPFGIFASGDLLIENCAFLQLGHTTQGGGHRPPNMRIYRAAVDTASAARVVVRDCVFAALLRIQFSINSPTKLLVTRNFFRSADSHWRLWLYLDNVEAREHEFLIQQNVIQGEDSTVLVGPPMTPARIVFDRNTFLSKAGYPVLQVNSSETEPDNTQMAAIRNVVFGPPNSWLTSSLKNAKQVRFNVVPAVHPDFETSLQCVTRFTPSLDAEQPDYMRLNADSSVGRALRAVGPDVVPGALPMHEPGRPEDWFDRLRKRWVEQMKLNEQLAEQLRAVPRQ